MPSTHDLSRRTALTVLGGAASASFALTGGTGLTASRNAVQSSEPRVVWARYYESGPDPDNDGFLVGDGRYQHTSVIQTADGGYAIAAGGTDVRQSETTGHHMMLLKLDGDGRYDWHSFSKGRDEEKAYKGRRAVDLLQTADGDYVLLGTDNRVAKLDATGTEQWVTYVQPEEYDDGGEYPTKWIPSGGLDFAVDGGYIVGVTFTYERPGLAKLSEDGEIVWHERYHKETDNGREFPQWDHMFDVVPVTDGYVFLYDPEYPRAMSKVDRDGNLQRDEELSRDVAFVGLERAQDDGFVLVGGNNDDGRDGGMVLVKLNADWDREWRKDHTGEIGAGPSTAVTTTDDGGYALSGALQKPYTDEDFAPGIVKTDADGNAEWFQRIDQVAEDSGKSAEGYSITQTDGGSFAITAEHYDHDHPGAAEVGTPENESTPAESPTPTESPTDTPGGTKTETATDSPPDGTTGRPDTATGETGTTGTVPGFGGLAAVGGLLGGVVYAIANRVRGPDE